MRSLSALIAVCLVALAIGCSSEIILHDVNYDYDPLAADPDFLVIGQFARISKIYDQVLTEGEFQFVASIQDYDVYSRTEP